MRQPQLGLTDLQLGPVYLLTERRNPAAHRACSLFELAHRGRCSLEGVAFVVVRCARSLFVLEGDPQSSSRIVDDLGELLAALFGVANLLLAQLDPFSCLALRSGEAVCGAA